MNYIVMDLEWNQPHPGALLRYKNSLCLNNEIIQIGAVKLDENFNVAGTFSQNVKPVIFKKINKNVKVLTGLNNDVLDDAPSLNVAIESFTKWCGEDFVFIIWGYDDIGVLGTNLKYIGLDTSWLPECYNLQMIFSSQTYNENKQYSLSYAAQHFGITLDKPLHNALTDAYYTAEICKKLDLKKGIKNYRAMVFKDKSIPEHMKNILYKQVHTPLKTYDEILEKSAPDKMYCYECKDSIPVSIKGKNGLYNFISIGECKLHGEFAKYVRIGKVEENSFNATEQFFRIDKYNKEYFVTKAKKMNLQNLKREKAKQNNKSFNDNKTNTSSVTKVEAKTHKKILLKNKA